MSFIESVKKTELADGSLADMAIFFKGDTMRGGGRGREIRRRLKRIKSLCSHCELRYKGSIEGMAPADIKKGKCTMVMHKTYPWGNMRHDRMTAVAPIGTFTAKDTKAACIKSA